ncbi:hypothetical protein BDR26DRAFT_1007035 [Obelidium mucronatum]|nr:hypothetical protein BDR26DRAFT_1007035 [Obelidium mucronatum]
MEARQGSWQQHLGTTIIIVLGFLINTISAQDLLSSGCYAITAAPRIQFQSNGIMPEHCAAKCSSSNYAIIAPTPQNQYEFYCACATALPSFRYSSGSCSFKCPGAPQPAFAPICGGYDLGVGYIAWSYYPVPPVRVQGQATTTSAPKPPAPVKTTTTTTTTTTTAAVPRQTTTRAVVRSTVSIRPTLSNGQTVSPPPLIPGGEEDDMGLDPSDMNGSSNNSVIIVLPPAGGGGPGSTTNGTTSDIDNNHSKPSSALIAGAVGATIFLIVGFAAVTYYQKRRRTASSSSNEAYRNDIYGDRMDLIVDVYADLPRKGATADNMETPRPPPPPPPSSPLPKEPRPLLLIMDDVKRGKNSNNNASYNSVSIPKPLPRQFPAMISKTTIKGVPVTLIPSVGGGGGGGIGVGASTGFDQKSWNDNGMSLPRQSITLGAMSERVREDLLQQQQQQQQSSVPPLIPISSKSPQTTTKSTAATTTTTTTTQNPFADPILPRPRWPLLNIHSTTTTDEYYESDDDISFRSTSSAISYQLNESGSSATVGLIGGGGESGVAKSTASSSMYMEIIVQNYNLNHGQDGEEEEEEEHGGFDMAMEEGELNVVDEIVESQD